MAKKPWQKSEAKAGDVAPGAKVHRGSGCLWWNPLDASSEDCMIENKFRSGGQYILKKKYLLECRKKAWRNDKKFAMRIDFDGEVFVVIPVEDLNE